MVRYTQHPDLDDGLARKFREGHVELFENGSFIATNNGQVVKSFEYNGEEYVIKRYPENSLRANIRSVLGVSRAMNSFVKAAKLQKVGVQTPSHLFVARHLGALKGESFLIMKKSLGESLYSMLCEEPPRRVSFILVAKLAEMTKKIHAVGFIHGDLHAGNIFVLEDGSVEIIDLDNLRINTNRRVRDQERLLRSFEMDPSLHKKLSLALANHNS